MVRTVEKLQREHGQQIVGLPRQVRADIAASFQRVAFTHVYEKVKIGLAWHQQNSKQSLTSMVVCGGVARNFTLREMLGRLSTEYNMDICFPPIDHCMDNGVMIAWAGIEYMVSGKGTILRDKREIEQLTELHKWPLAENPHVFGVRYIQPVALRRIGKG